MRRQNVEVTGSKQALECSVVESSIEKIVQLVHEWEIHWFSGCDFDRKALVGISEIVDSRRLPSSWISR